MSGARRALVVGIDDYPTSPLGGCVNDANAVGVLLERHAEGTPNFAVRRLLGPPDAVTRTVLRDAVADLFSQPGDMSRFYFAGHGSENNLGGYLAAIDTQSVDDGVPMNDVTTRANQQDRTEAVIIVDC